MDYVYICRPGKNEELRYSIRSVVKYASHNKIWVVGDKPDWYHGNFVEVPDTSTKFENIKACTAVIPEIGGISDDFVLMNDDFFLLTHVGKMPVYHGGPLADKLDKYIELGARQYAALLSRTYKNLIRQGIEVPLDYDLHVPMPMNKEKLKESIDKAYFPRSGYGNIHNMGGKLITDVKTYTDGSLLSERSYDFTSPEVPFISTEDGSFEKVYNNLLKDLFSEPSQYEII